MIEPQPSRERPPAPEGGSGQRAVANLADIAREVGCSKMTVSRVLHNDRHVKKETREKVLRAIERVGYKPNPMVMALMHQMHRSSVKESVGVLGYLVSGPQREHWKSYPTYLRFFEGAGRSADRHGYRLETFWVNDPGVSQKRLSQILYARGICGLVVGPMKSHHGHLNLEWDKFCAVAVGYSLLKPFLPRVSNDQYSSTLVALRKLHRLGYRRIALAMPPGLDPRVHYKWSAAFLSFHYRHALKNAGPLLMQEEWSRKRVVSWIKRTRPEAILSVQHEIPFWLKEEGYRLPEDFGFVNLDWTELNGPCAGIDQRSEAVGSAAVDLVVGQINRNDYGLPADAPSLLLPGVWVDGPTVRAVNVTGNNLRTLKRLGREVSVRR